jgi:hypothetical protein
MIKVGKTAFYPGWACLEMWLTLATAESGNVGKWRLNATTQQKVNAAPSIKSD